MPLPEPQLPSGQSSVWTGSAQGSDPIFRARMEPCQTRPAKQNVGLKTEGMKEGESGNTHLRKGWLKAGVSRSSSWKSWPWAGSRSERREYSKQGEGKSKHKVKNKHGKWEQWSVLTEPSVQVGQCRNHVWCLGLPCAGETSSDFMRWAIGDYRLVEWMNHRVKNIHLQYFVLSETNFMHPLFFFLSNSLWDAGYAELKSTDPVLREFPVYNPGPCDTIPNDLSIMLPHECIYFKSRKMWKIRFSLFLEKNPISRISRSSGNLPSDLKALLGPLFGHGKIHPNVLWVWGGIWEASGVGGPEFFGGKKNHKPKVERNALQRKVQGRERELPRALPGSPRVSQWAGPPGRRDRCQAERWQWRPVSDCAISSLPRSIMRPQPVKNHSLSKALSPATYH